MFPAKALSPDGGAGRRGWRGGNFLGLAGRNLESELEGSSKLGDGVLFGGS